jgi:hypothetical protein
VARRVADPRSPAEIREVILADYPWVRERGQTMVLGTDLDALISAAFMYQHFDWTPVGVYNLKSIFAADGATNEQLRDAVWVDLDIAREEIRSIGHHILTNARTERLPEHRQSLNPNLVRGISLAQFARKYPLSTHHLLMWLTDTPAPGRPTDRYLIWLPDSCWITAQGRWLDNVRDWLTNWMPHPFLLDSVEDCRTLPYEEGMHEFLTEFDLNVPLPAGRGQTRSLHLGITGFQCRYDDPRTQSGQVQQTLNYLAELMGWRPMSFPAGYQEIVGIRNRHQTNLPDFLHRENIFSYALPNAGVINFTSFDGF